MIQKPSYFNFQISYENENWNTYSLKHTFCFLNIISSDVFKNVMKFFSNRFKKRFYCHFGSLPPIFLIFSFSIKVFLVIFSKKSDSYGLINFLSLRIEKVQGSKVVKLFAEKLLYYFPLKKATQHHTLDRCKIVVKKYICNENIVKKY